MKFTTYTLLSQSVNFRPPASRAVVTLKAVGNLSAYVYNSGRGLFNFDSGCLTTLLTCIIIWSQALVQKLASRLTTASVLLYMINPLF